MSVAITGEEFLNPLLLLGRETAPAVHIAIVGAVSTEVSREFAAHQGCVALFHILEDPGKSHGRAYGLYLPEERAPAVIKGGRGHRDGGEQGGGNGLSAQMVHALVFERAAVDEAQGVAGGDVFVFEFHDGSVDVVQMYAIFW